MEIKKKLNINKYWNVMKCVNQNCMVNIIMGGRGMGKTTQALIYSLNEVEKGNGLFLYVRRYKSDSGLCKSLLNDLVENVTYQGDGNGGGCYSVDKQPIGYNLALSSANKYKSLTFLEKVTNIIYDEAIIKRSLTDRYLTNEVEQLLELLSTIQRTRSFVRVFIIGNNLDFRNPYLTYFNIKTRNKKYIDKERGIYVEYCEHSPELIKVEENTSLYKLTKGTAYHEYHYNNKVLQKELIEFSQVKSSDKVDYRIIINNATLLVYSRSDGRKLLHSVNSIINDNPSFILYENNILNEFNVALLRDIGVLMGLKIMYYNKKIDYTNNDAYNMLQTIFEIANKL